MTPITFFVLGSILSLLLLLAVAAVEALRNHGYVNRILLLWIMAVALIVYITAPFCVR